MVPGANIRIDFPRLELAASTTIYLAEQFLRVRARGHVKTSFFQALFVPREWFELA